MDVFEIDLHDAILDGVGISFASQSVEIHVLYYPDADASTKRIRARIMFSGVTEMSDVLDLVALADNRSPGNISYWNPADGVGTTYIYLVSGLISIKAKELSFESIA